MNNKFNIGDKVWFKLDSYGRKAEMHGTIRNAIYTLKKGFTYDIETFDHKHWNIPEKDINYSAPHTREYNKISYNCISEKEKEYAKRDEESCKDFMNRIYGALNSEPEIHPFMPGDLVMYRDASKPEVFTVIEVIEFKNPIGSVSYSYRIKRTVKDGQNVQDIIRIVDHDKIKKVQQFKGGYEYKRGDCVRFEYDGYVRAGEVIELLYTDTDKGALYKIRGRSGNEYLVSQDKIIRYDTTDSLKRKLDRIHSNSVYGLNTDLTIFDKFINKETKNMKQQQKKRNHDFVIAKEQNFGRRIKEVIFNGPATIIKWQPTLEQLEYGKKGDKTVVVCQDGDKQDMKTGFLLAIIKEMVDNQSYDNILRKIDSFEKFDIPQVNKEEDDSYKFQVGDIVRLKNGSAWFKVIKQTFFMHGNKKVNRYRLQRYANYGVSDYTCYENENRLELVRKGDK